MAKLTVRYNQSGLILGCSGRRSAAVEPGRLASGPVLVHQWR